MGTAREEGDGIRRVQVNDLATRRDPQLCDKGDGTIEDNESGCSYSVTRTVFVGGRA